MHYWFIHLDANKILSFFGVVKFKSNLTLDDIILDGEHPPGDIIDHDINIVQDLFYPDAFLEVLKSGKLHNSQPYFRPASSEGGNNWHFVMNWVLQSWTKIMELMANFTGK